MQQDGAITNIDDLGEYFTDCGAKYVYWTAYRADGKTILLRNESTEDKNDSWDLLKRTLLKNSKNGGKFFLHITNVAKGSGGYQPEVVLPPQNLPQQAGQGGSAISGLPLGIGSLTEYGDRLKKEWEMEARIKELEKKDDSVNPYIGAMLAHPTFKVGDVLNFGHRLVGILERVSGLQMPNGATAIGIAGLNNHYDLTKTTTTDEKTNDTNDEAEVITYDGEALGDVCDELRAIDPTLEPENFLLGMMDFLKENPHMKGLVLGQVQPFYEKRKTATHETENN